MGLDQDPSSALGDLSLPLNSLTWREVVRYSVKQYLQFCRIISTSTCALSLFLLSTLLYFTSSLISFLLVPVIILSYLTLTHQFFFVDITTITWSLPPLFLSFSPSPSPFLSLSLFLSLFFQSQSVNLSHSFSSTIYPTSLFLSFFFLFFLLPFLFLESFLSIFLKVLLTFIPLISDLLYQSSSYFFSFDSFYLPVSELYLYRLYAKMLIWENQIFPRL